MTDERLIAEVLRLTEIMRRLRRECPWDRKQTPESLRRYLIEETHEVLEALDDGDRRALKGELGDLLFQVWFHAEIAGEGGPDAFDLADVLGGISEKLTRRHPHVFGEGVAKDAVAVREKWDELKLKEGRTSRLDGIPKFLPALLQAAVVQDKAVTAGFAFPTIAGDAAKLREEVLEFADAAAAAEARPLDPEAFAARAGEYGDLLFALVGLGRRMGISAEDALRLTTRKFMRRFRTMEEALAREGTPIADAGIERLLDLWRAAKAAERPGAAPSDDSALS